jgi:RHS repeat-associated protein
MFTGKERDQESTNDYFGARYYASTMGRFMSPDPSGLLYADPTSPQSLNLYSYVLNNPLSFVDPFGLDCVYFNDAGNGIESVDRNSNSGECGQNGGDWVNGTLRSAQYFGDSDTWGFRSNDANNNYLTYANAPGTESSGIPCSGNCDLANGYFQSSNSSPGLFDLPQNQRIQQLVQGVARDTAGFPDVCSGGAFVYAGVQGKVGSGHGFAGYLGNYDSKEGWSNNGLVEGSKGNASAGAAAGSKGAEGLVFIPFAEAGGGLVGVSKNGLSVGGYAGTPESVPVGAGGGAYFTISTMGGCAHR